MKQQSKKISNKNPLLLSWGGLFYGILFVAVGLYEFGDENAWFLVVAGVLLICGSVIGLKYSQKRKKNLEAELLNRYLYELIKENNGKVTAIEFAMRANIEPQIAREFIETKVSQIGSVPEIDDQGTIYYLFK